jgi:hypothetical protein
MERLMDMALILFALAPLVAAYHGGSPSPLALSRLAGGLVGAGVVYWLLWTSHGLRIAAWAVALLVAVGRTLVLVNSPRFSPEKEAGLVAVSAVAIVVLLAIGWWGRTPERSRLIYLILLVPNLAMLAVGAGVVLLEAV